MLLSSFAIHPQTSKPIQSMATLLLHTSSSFLSISPLPPLQFPTPSRASPIVASSGKKVTVKEPLGPSGDTKFRGGLDASGQKQKGKGVYQYAKKYGANVDGYSPIYTPEEWSPTGDVYVGGTTGLAIWAVTLGAVLLGGVLLVYNTSALAQ